MNGLKWNEHTSQFSKYFIENHNDKNDKGYFVEVDIQHLENLHEAKTLLQSL